MTKEKEQIAKTPIVANGRGLVLRTIDDMFRFGQAVVQSGFAPSSFKTPQQIIVAIQSGAELGMPPMRSLQSFCVINNKAMLYGDAPLALVKQSGLLEWINEWIEGEGDERVAFCETQRKGDPGPVVRTFSVADAIQAKLWNKPGPWQQYEKRMLQCRARSLNLRDAFPDCFGGATIAEEYMGIEPPEPSHETTVPKRDERKIVDSQKVEENEVLQDVILAVYKSYEKKFREPTVEHFAELSAEHCGGERDDYWNFDDDMNPILKTEAYNSKNLQAIREVIVSAGEKEVENERQETKTKVVRDKKIKEADSGGQVNGTEMGQMSLASVEDGKGRNNGAGDTT